MGRGPIRRQRNYSWYEETPVTTSSEQIVISSEVKLYTIKDIMEMSGWSETTVQKLFNDPDFPSIDYGKSKLVENHALIQFLSVKNEKAKKPFWRDGIAGTRNNND